MNKQRGLMPEGCTRWDIASAHAAFCDWWNANGTTPRDFDPKRRIRPDGVLTASVQLSRMRYRNPYAYFGPDDEAAIAIYLALVDKYFPGEEGNARVDLYNSFLEEYPDFKSCMENPQ